MIENKNSGTFVISLDFELIWGIFDHITPEQKIKYFQNTREVIPQICQLFEQNQIAATWATVGMLLHESWDDWLAHQPAVKPQYTNTKLNPYAFAGRFRQQLPETLFFAPQLVRCISKTPFQELGTHTYSHYYCLEPGQEEMHFAADLQMAVRLFQRLGITPQSLVFPRNQYAEQYLQTCFQQGITTVRTNPKVWFWNNQSNAPGLFKKVFRTGDAYVPLQKMTYELSSLMLQDEVVLQPASRFFRPFGTSNSMRLFHRKRVMDEMTYAAKKGEVYHLWWHPHNFGEQPEQCLLELRLIVDHFKRLHETFGMKSSTMSELEATWRLSQK